MNPMRTAFSFASPSGIESELLAVLAADTQTASGPDAKPRPTLLTADPAVLAAAAAVLSTGEFKAGANETVLLHAPAGLAAKRLLIVGLGKLSRVTIHKVRDAAGTAVRFAKPRGIRELALTLPRVRRAAPRSGRGPGRRRRIHRRFRSRHLPQRSQRSKHPVIHSGSAAGSRPRSHRSRYLRRRDHWRKPELCPLARQRARQQAHAHHPRPARRGNGSGR